MLWVVKQNEDGSYLIGDTKRDEKYWQTASEDGVYALAMMNDIYGVSDNKIKPQGSLENIVSRYNARLRVAGLGDSVRVRVVSLRDNSVVTWDNTGRTIMGIAIMPLVPEGDIPRRCFKMPEFVEIVQGMNWFFEDVYIPSSVKWIYRGEESRKLEKRNPFRSLFPCKVIISSTECVVAEEAFSHSTCTEVLFSSRCRLTLERRSFDKAAYLKSIVLPEGLTYLGSNTFDGCLKLNSVHLPNSLRFLSASAFFSCPLIKYLWLPDNVKLDGELSTSMRDTRLRLSQKLLLSCMEDKSIFKLGNIIVRDSEVLRKYLKGIPELKESKVEYAIEDDDFTQSVVVVKDDSREAIDALFTSGKL